MAQREVPLTVNKDGEKVIIGKTIICDNVFLILVDDTELARELLPTISLKELSVRRPLDPKEHDA